MTQPSPHAQPPEASFTYPVVDLIKLCCSFLILMSHASPFAGLGEQVNLYAVNLSFRFAVPFFFLCTGFFTLGHPTLPNVLRYLKRIFLLYLVWTLLFFLVNPPQSLTWAILPRFFLSGSTDAYWYFPSLMLSCLLTYFLLAKLPLPISFLIALALYGFGLAGDSYWRLLGTNPIIKPLLQAYNTVFIEAKRGILFPTLFLLTGAAIGRTPSLQRFSPKEAGLLLALSYLLFVLEFVLIEVKHTHWGRNMTVMIVPVSTLLFVLALQKRREGSSPRQLWLRRMSTLVYCAHVPLTVLGERLIPQDVRTAYAPLFFFTILAGTLLLAMGILRLAQKWKWLRILY